jgi:ketosteroid isomerase-like protein
MFNPSMISRRQAFRMKVTAGLALAIPAFAGFEASDESAEPIKSLLATHNKAFTAHDMKGVLATLSPSIAMLGTGPGEIWSGHKEVADAYQHFFADFDPGKQSFEMLWSDSGVNGDIAWLATENKVTMSKAARKIQFGLNLSLIVERISGKWMIRTMHFSNVVGADKSHA